MVLSSTPDATNGFGDVNTAVDTTLAFTAFTSNPKVATVAYGENANGVIAAWWNTLGLGGVLGWY